MWNWFTNLFKINESASRRAMLGGLLALPLLKYIPGSSSFDVSFKAGLFYPYIPLQQIPLSTMTGPTGQIIGFKTRYGVPNAQTTSYHADLPGGVRCTAFGYAPDRSH